VGVLWVDFSLDSDLSFYTETLGLKVRRESLEVTISFLSIDLLVLLYRILSTDFSKFLISFDDLADFKDLSLGLPFFSKLG